MPTEVILPRVDMDMAEGQIGRWFVEDGAKVEKGQPLFEIETDKAAMEIEAPASGVIRGMVAASGAAVPVGTTVAWILAEGEALPETTAAAPADDGGAPPTAPAATHAASAAGAPSPPAALLGQAVAAGTDGRRATPLARRLARQRGVDLASLAGSGPRGRIQSGDVPAAEIDATASRSPAGVPAGAPPLAARPLRTPASPAAPATVASDGRLNRVWLRRGDGAAVVMIHGFGAELGGWRPFLAGARIERPILAVDLPGHGASPLAGAASLDDLVAAVVATLAAEGVVEADLIGHSLGGAVATAIAAGGEIGVRSLMLIAPAGLGPDVDGAFLDGYGRAASEASLAPWMSRLVADPAALPAGFVQATARGRAVGDVAESQRRLAASLFPDGTQAFSTRALLERLAMPVKVVFGRDDRIIPAGHANGLPGTVAVHLFAGVGHLPQIEARDAVARLWLELLRSA